MIELIIEHRKRLRRTRKFHMVLCIIGMILSVYSVYVEVKLESNPSYTALCDISPGISCTAVFGSAWGKGFGVVGKIIGDNSTFNQPNGIYGAISGRFDSLFLGKTTLFIGVIGVLLSGYLAYILVYILNDICVVCYTIYGINFLLLITSVLIYKHMKSLHTLVNIHSSPPKAEKKRV